MDHFLLPSDHQPTVLIVDDSVENLQILSALLRDDYKVKAAKGGLKALELISADAQIDLVLLDIMMPDMDGYQVCEIIKKNPISAKIPVIFLTALNESSDETKGFSVGGADFIVKPFNADVVKARVKTHIELREERKVTERLLKVLLPENAIQQLIRKGSYSPEIHPDASILFCDLDGFTQISSTLSPEDLVQELTDIFSNFDRISEAHHVVRIKTIGDAYMAVAGLDSFDGPGTHAADLVAAGLEFIRFLADRNTKFPVMWKCRVGVHTGGIISGIIGRSRFQFDVMGDHVNIAARVERSSQSMALTVTEQTLQHLDKTKYRITPKGDVFLKGKGEMPLFEVAPVS